MTEQNLYDILEVTKDCDQATIKKHYKRLAHKYHPDKATGDTETFQRIKHAYEVLSDPEKRNRYDATGEHNHQAGQDPVTKIVLQTFMKVIDKMLAGVQEQNSLQAMMQQQGRFEGDVVHDVNEQIKSRVKELKGGITSIQMVLKELYKVQGKVQRDDDKPNLFESLLQQKADMGKANIESLEAELAANEGALKEINHYRDTGASKRITQAFEVTAQHIRGNPGQSPFGGQW